MHYKNIVWFLIFILFISCPRRPHWYTNLTIPLISNKKFKVIDFLDSSRFRIGDDSIITFYYRNTIDSFFPIDSLRISDLLDSTKIYFRDFTVSNLDSTRIALSSSEITGLVLPETTTYVTIPPFSRIITRPVRFRNFEFLSVAMAKLKITIYNRTRLIFDTIDCFLDGTELVHLLSVDSMSVSEHIVRLENLNLDSILVFSTHITSSGSSNSIPISANDSLVFIVSFDSLKINSGAFRSCVPRNLVLNKQKICYLQSNYSIRLTNLEFNSGRLSVSLQNNFPFSCSVAIFFTEFNIDTAFQIFSYDSLTINFELTSYHNNSAYLIPITLNYTLAVSLDSSLITILPDHFLRVDYQLQNIEVDSVVAIVLDTINHSLVSKSITFNLPNYAASIYLNEVYLDADLTNALYVSMILSLQACAQNSSGETLILDTCLFLIPGNPSMPTINNFRLNLTRLFNIHPTTLNLNIRLLIIDSISLSRQSFIVGIYEINSPLSLQILPDTLTFGPYNITISNEVREKIINDIDSANFYTHFINHLPFSISGKIILENSQARQIFIPVDIPRGQLNNSGIVYEASKINLNISLSSIDVSIFTDSLIYFILKFYLPQTDTIKIMVRDFLLLVNSYAVVTTNL
ncbi:MAG: hypothetical protein ABIK10_01135 [candidate division WOR-3 bacterium]